MALTEIITKQPAKPAIAEPEKALKIFTVSLIGSKKFQAGAVYSEDKGLVIASVIPISGTFGSWRQPLIDNIKRMKESGAAVLVEENGETISQHATRYNLEDTDEEIGSTKTNLALALDAYFQLQDSDYLHIHPDYQRFALQLGNEGSWIEKKNDDKGRAYYSVDWQKFSGAHRVMLLCVVAALYEPLSGRFLEAMFGQEDEVEPAIRRIDRWKQIFKDMGVAKEAVLMEARGQR